MQIEKKATNIITENITITIQDIIKNSIQHAKNKKRNKNKIEPDDVLHAYFLELQEK